MNQVNFMTQPSRKQARYLFGFLMALVAIGAPLSAGAQRLCFPQYTGVPYTWVPPAVDGTFVSTFNGDVDKDTGWTNGFRYVLSNGTPATDGSVQAVQDSSNHFIYLAFQIRNDSSFDTEDSVVIGFNPDNTGPGVAGANMQRIIIHPVVGGAGATDPNGHLAAGQIEYAKGYNPGTGGWPAPTLDPPFITAVAQSAGAVPPLVWNLQVRIKSDVTGLNLPGGDFGMYINLVRVANAGTDTQFTWPPATPLIVPIQGTEILLEGDSLPLTNAWGTASLATSCSGVRVSSISTNHAGVISLNQPNQFSAVVTNTGTKNANNIKATFQIANFGLPAPEEWRRPGELHNNLIPNDPVGPLPVNGMGGTNTFTTGSWTLGTNASIDPVNIPQNEHDFYAINNHGHECIRVTLDSTDPDTVFGVQSSWSNFNFGNTSEFTHEATIGTKGYKLREGQNQLQFDLTVNRQVIPGCTDKCALANNPEQGRSKLNYVVTGCRRTGQFLVINKKKFENCEDAGAFGFGLSHDGPVKDFTDELLGEGLEKGKDNSYHISIAKGKQAVLRTHVVSIPVTPPKPPNCGKGDIRSAGIFLFSGLFVFGIVVFRPRKRKANS
jgi:hypothetical protein